MERGRERKGRNGKGTHRPWSGPPYFLLRIYAHEYVCENSMTKNVLTGTPTQETCSNRLDQLERLYGTGLHRVCCFQPTIVISRTNQVQRAWFPSAWSTLPDADDIRAISDSTNFRKELKLIICAKQTMSLWLCFRWWVPAILITELARRPIHW